MDTTITWMRERSYAEKFRNRRGLVRLFGVVCGCVARNFLENGAATAWVFADFAVSLSFRLNQSITAFMRCTRIAETTAE